MGWFVRLSRFATAHMVYAQEKANSCGPSCIVMANFKLKKGLMAAGMQVGSAMSVTPVVGAYLGATLTRQAVSLAVKTEPEVYAAYARVTGAAYDGTTYTFATKLADVFAELRLGDWMAEYVGPAGVGQAVSDAVAKGSPVIVHVGWAAGGAHFVLADDVVEFLGTTYVLICDPGDGELHVQPMSKGGAVTYTAGEPITSFSASEHFTYPAGQIGTFSGWIVRRKD